MRTFSEDLMKWWSLNKRIFPWRSERDPYRLLVAEVLLHRTKAKGVVTVYEELLTQCPDIQTLADARLKDLKKITKSLGLGWRIKSLKEAAVIVVNEFGGKVPIQKDKLLSLPGVGDYIASAIGVFAEKSDSPLIDSNTTRIILRVYGLPLTDSARRKKDTSIKYEWLRSGFESMEFGFAMIDLASKVCILTTPRCGICPLVFHCATGSRLSER